MALESEDLAQSISRWSAHIEEQKQRLDAEVRRLKIFQQDYDALEKQLQTLPDETVRPAMIPIGGLAFMPGKLIHTNEITVYLGANYYAERSAKQALAIVNRRREVVKENLRLVEGQLNNLLAKEKTSYGVFPSNELGVNEEGLPIMEIREELPDEEHTQKTDKAVEPIREEELEKAEKPLGDGKRTATKVWEEKEYKDLMAMLQKLEEEEEMEGEMNRVTAQEEVPGRYKTDSDEDEDDSDDNGEYSDDLYDTEIADNLFDQFDDDEEYATQGIVEYEDATVYEDEGRQKGEAGNVKEIVKDETCIMQNVREIPPEERNVAVASTSTDHRKIASEREEQSLKSKKPSRFKAAREQIRREAQQTKDVPSSDPEMGPQIPTVESSGSLKKLSQLKPSCQERVMGKSAPDNSTDKNSTSISDSKGSMDIDSNRQIPVVETSAPSKRMSRFKAARQQERDAKTASPKDDSVLKADTNSQMLPEEISTPQKKVSRFKLARQQQTIPNSFVREIPAVATAVPVTDKQPTSKEAEPSLRTATSEVSNSTETVSRVEDAREQDIPADGKASSYVGIGSVEHSSDGQKTPTSSANEKHKRRVTWDKVATVQEHDRYAAPADVASNTYIAPVKQAEKVHVPPQTVKSPADIFNLVQAQRQVLMDDGYPSLETGEDNFKVDMEDLGRSVNLGKQELWQLKDESKQPFFIKEIKEVKKSNLPVVPKTKLDTNVMRGAVIEHDIEPVDIEEVEIDMDFREVTSSYHNIRNNFVAAMGGYTFEPKDTIQVWKTRGSETIQSSFIDDTLPGF
ncbi:Prefoldin subunit-domain-containing protein [Dichotomocladium elegans]|nr:Prefoldin subunit-domain-containing protein [Dichotomocladium elegans]